MDAEHEDASEGRGGPWSRLHPALATAMDAGRAETIELHEPSTAVDLERSMLAVQSDPTVTADPAEFAADAVAEARRRTQVRWARPTDLAMQAGARATGWGLDLRAELGQRLQDATRDSQRLHRRGDRKRWHLDLSVSGRHRQSRQEPARLGMDLR